MVPPMSHKLAWEYTKPLSAASTDHVSEELEEPHPFVRYPDSKSPSKLAMLSDG